MNKSGFSGWALLGKLWLVAGVLSVFCEAQVVYDKQLTIQPIQVKSATQTANSSQQLWQDITQAIYDQAQIKVVFLPWSTFVSDTFINVGNPPYTATFDNLTILPQFKGGSSSPTVVNMWFVRDLREDGTGANLGGLTFGSAVVIDDEGVALSATIPHELGHTMLGSSHPSVASVGANNLMVASPIDPSSVNDVINGLAGSLNSTQISSMRSSGLLTAIPESEGWASAAALAVVSFAFYRRLRSGRTAAN